MKEFITAVEEIEAEDAGEKPEEKYTAFKVDGRELRAYQPTDGQLTFMLAGLGRGQTNDKRFAVIVNLMLSVLRDDDQDYLESRMLDRNPKTNIGVKKIEEIFEFLMEEWFARPTQQPSDSV